MQPEDLTRFDLILGMDMDNIQEIKRAADFWRGERGDGAIPIPSLTELDGKVKRITQYCTRNDANTVPDPYYGGRKGFEIVLDLLEDACEGLLDDLVRENSRGGRDSARW